MANQPTKYRKFIVGAASAALVASAVAPVASAKDFKDTKGNTHEAAIDALSDAGVISGYEDGTFKPNKTLTRSDVVKMMGKWLVAEGYEVPEDYKTNMRFSDLKASTNDELLKYAAVVKDNGVFNGSNGRLLAGDNMSRENMAVVLVRAFDTVKEINLVEYVEGQDFKKEVTDLNSAKSEARTAINVLDFFDITTVAQFNPKDTTTRGHFATFLNNFLKADLSKVTGVVAGVESVTAVNNTTVEVKFVEKVEDLAALDFAIEGLKIDNKVLKQTDAKTVVLTTAAQEAGKTYTVNANDNKIGTFVGASAVVPTGISVANKSVQGVIGKDVTVSATVTVAEGQSNKAGIPVTFNIVNSNNTNEKLEAVAYTNAEGVASYTYTRYYASEDNVTAYATQRSTVYSQGKVYWATAEQLTIKDVTGVNSLANNDSKVYEINSAKNANKYVFVTFKENLNQTADKVVRTVVAKGASTHYLANNNTISGTAEYPYEITTGSKAVIAVKLDPNGKANLVLSGTNATVTPIVYEGVAVDGTDAGSIAGDLLTEFTNASYNALALQATASAVTFEAKHVLGLTIEAQGVANAATYKNSNETGGRDYTVTYVDKDGKPAKAGNLVKIAIPVQSASNNVFLLDSDGNKVPGVTVGEYRVFDKAVTGNEGKVKFTVVSDYVTQFVEPTVYVDNGTGVGAKVGLDATDLQAKGAVTHFTDQITYSTSLELVDAAGRAIKSVLANSAEKAYFQYETVDQNGKARAYRLADGTTAPTTLTYTVQAGTAPVTVVNGVGTSSTVASGGTGQYNLVIPANSYSGALEVTAATATTASVYATATVAGLVLGTTDTVTATFTGTSVVNVNGTVTNVNKSTSVVHINNVPYSLAGATYLNGGTVVPTLSAFYDHLTVGKTVSVTKDADGNLVFNVTGEATPATPITSAVLAEDGTKLTLTFAQNIDATLTGSLVGTDFTFTKADGTTVVTPAGTLAYALDGNNKVVISGITGGLEATDIINVAADALVYVGGTSNTALTKAITQPFASKLSTLATSTPSVKEVIAADAKDATADVVIGDAEFTVTVLSSVATVENFNGVKVQFEADQSSALPTATYDAFNKLITVKVGYSAADNTIADLEAAVQAIAPTATIDFSQIDLAVTAPITSGDLVDVLDLATAKTVEIKNGLAVNAGTAGIYTFALNQNLVSGNKVVLNGKTYVAGTDFVVASTKEATAANLAAKIQATDNRFVTAAAVSTNVITLTDAAKNGAAAPTLSLQ